MKNPIIDNRIVNDKTFARRLRSFLKNVEPKDCMTEEEITYLSLVADKLLFYQLETCPEKEKAYHLNFDKNSFKK